MAVRGVQPVFISCKTCEIKTEALNELAILRDRFGGKGSRAVIVTSANASRCRSVMHHRAAELDIEVIEWNDLRLERLMIMRDQISRFMQEFPEAKKQSFAGNPFGDFVRTEIPEVLYNTGFVNREEYLVKASVGQGNWVTIPWIAIMHPSITTTPQEGVYIVYLLSADSKRLYLSFNQGCTKIKNNHSKNETISILENAADEIRKKINGQGFSTEKDIELGDRSSGNGIFYG